MCVGHLAGGRTARPTCRVTMIPMSTHPGMKIGYFVNQYPKVSHSFIRREIHAMERLGFVIERYALRGWDAELVDPLDRAELPKTKFVLQRGVTALFWPALRELLASPVRFVRALAVALAQWRAGDRSLILNLISLAEACLLKQWLRRDSVPHLHAHFGTNSTLIAMLVKALGGPGYSFTMHGSEEWDSPLQLRLGAKVQQARFVAAISSFTRAQLYRWSAPQDYQKIAVVHCGLDAQFLDSAAPPLTDCRRLVCVGRLCAAKAQTLLIEAMARLARDGIEFDLVLAGDGETRPQVEQLIQQHGLQSRVRITGWIDGDQVRQELLAARALILPSLVEGIPVVIMEALALRRPVISTYVGGIAELVRPGHEGWLFPPSSVDEMIAAVKECMQAPVDKLRAMGDSGRERVLRSHAIDHEAQHLARLMRGAVS